MGSDPALSVDPAGWNLERICHEGTISAVILQMVTPIDAKMGIAQVKTVYGRPPSDVEMANIKFHLNRVSVESLSKADGLVLAVLSPGPQPGSSPMCSVVPVRGFNREHVITLFRRWREGAITPDGQEDPATQRCLRRASWRVSLTKKENLRQTAREIIGSLKDAEQVPAAEKAYALGLLGLPDVRDLVLEDILSLAKGDEAEKAIDVRTAWLELLARLVGKPGRLDLDVLEPTCLRYSSWWDAETMKAASLKDRARYCMAAFALSQHVEDSLPLLRQYKQGLEKRKEGDAQIKGQ